MTRKELAVALVTVALVKEFTGMLINLGGPAIVVLVIGYGIMWWLGYDDNMGVAFTVIVIGVFTFAATMIWQANRHRLNE